MKVLILSSSASIHTQRWVNSLAKVGLDIVLVSQHKPIGEFNASVRYYQLKDYGELGYFLHAGQVRKIIRNEAPELVHAHFASGYGTLAKNTGVKYILSVWGSDVYEFPDKSFMHRWLLKRSLNSAIALFSTSHCMKKRTAEFTNKSISVIPFGVETESFYKRSSTSDTFHIGLVKVLNEKYGIDVLLKAFSILINNSKSKSLKLSIAGDGPKAAEYKLLAEELGISKYTNFLGWIDNKDVPRFLAGLDLFAIPSRWDGESFGVVAVEAGAASLPCVVSDVGGLPEVIIDGETGIVVPKDDFVLLAEAMQSLIDDEDHRVSLGSAARHRVKEQYEWSENVDSMYGYYRKIAGEIG